MNRFSLIPQLYGRLLRLYPTSFRAEFADEMQIVFEAAWWDAVECGEMWSFCRRELISLLWEAGRVGADRLLLGEDPVAQARLIIRAASLLLGLFYLKVTLRGVDGGMALLNGIVLIGVLVAWRWERLGVTLMVASALLAGLLLAIAQTGIPGFTRILWLGLIPAVLYPLPFVLFGAMLIILNRTSHVEKVRIA